jgi:YbbR domain-containing protein
VIKEVPLEIITPTDVIPSNEIPDKVQFRLEGPKAFLRTVTDRHEEPIRVNLAGAKPGLVTYNFFSNSIRLPIGVKVVSINPASLLIKLENLRRREVAVKVETSGTPPDGYRLVKTEVEPPLVKIKGPESKVDSIAELPTTPVELGSLKAPTEREVALEIARFGVQLESPLPHVKLDIEPVSANYRIKNVDIRVITSYKVKLDETSVTVLVRADAKDVKQLDRSHVYAVVDLSGKDKGKYQAVVKVTLPDGVSLVRVVPEKVNVTLY